MALGDEDLPWMIAEQGVPVILGYEVTLGIPSHFTAEMLRDSDAPDLMSRALVVVIKSDSLPSLKSGADITVDGVPCVVRRYSKEGHGKLTSLTCVRVA